MKPLARFVGPVPGLDQSIELHNLLLETEQLIAERGKAHARNLRHPFVTRVSNNVEQFGQLLCARPGRQCRTRQGGPGSH